MQAPQTQRVTGRHFFQKKQKKQAEPAILLLKKVGGDGDGNDVVRSMSAGGNSKAANRKENCEVNPRNRPKGKPRYIEGVHKIGLAR